MWRRKLHNDQTRVLGGCVCFWQVYNLFSRYQRGCPHGPHSNLALTDQERGKAAANLLRGVASAIWLWSQWSEGCENQVADHLYHYEPNVVSFEEKDNEESFPDELVMALSNNTTPWYANFANNVVCGLLPKGMNGYQCKRFLFDVKN